MQDAYKRILERRRSQLVEQIKWSREFSAGLQRHGLLSRDQLRDLELELNHKNRVFMVLTQVMARDEAGVFERFRQLLAEVGVVDMAESLDFDRQRIVWDFERRSKTCSLMHYIDLLNAELLQPSISEPEADVRNRMVLEARSRLEELRNSLRQQQLDRDHFREAILHVIGSAAETTQSLTANGHSVDQSSGTSSPGYTLSELEDLEYNKDRALIDEVASTFGRLTRTVRHLRDVSRRQKLAVTEENSDDIKDADDDRLVHDRTLMSASSESDNHLTKSTANNSRMSNGIDFDNESENGFELKQDPDLPDNRPSSLDRSEYEQLVELLRPFSNGGKNDPSMTSSDKNGNGTRTALTSSDSSSSLTRYSTLSRRNSPTSTGRNSSASTENDNAFLNNRGQQQQQRYTSLLEMAKSTVAELERWKKRTCQLSAEIRRLDADKEIAAAAKLNSLADLEVSESTLDLEANKVAATAAVRTRRISMPHGRTMVGLDQLQTFNGESSVTSTTRKSKAMVSSASTSQLMLSDDSFRSSSHRHRPSSTSPLGSLTAVNSGGGWERATTATGSRSPVSTGTPLLLKRKAAQQQQQQQPQTNTRQQHRRQSSAFGPSSQATMTSSATAIAADRVRKLSLAGQYPPTHFKTAVA